MKIFYDCEFIEDGRTIDLISIGLVAEDGREYYAVNQNAPWPRVRRHEWLMANVVPHLPKAYGDARNHMPKRWLFNLDDPCVKPKAHIAAEVKTFLLGDDRLVVPDIELWAWYGAYDHVCLSQLWGRMIDHPEGVPMWTNDLRQECERLGNPALPEQAEGEHNALADARHNKVRADFLAAIAPWRNTMSDEPKIDDEILADDFADFLTRGLAAQRAVDEVIAASACAEKWYDEVGCSAADGVHRCREHGAHRTHRCIDCDAMVIEDRP